VSVVKQALGSVGVALILVVVLAGCSQPSSGPSQRVLSILEKTRAVIPASATDVRFRAVEAVWVQPCSEFQNAQAGWSPDEVLMSFTDASSTTEVLAGIDAALSRQGWQRHDEVITRGQGTVPHWTLATSFGGKANLFAFEAPAGSRDWYVNPSWQPPGPKADGCP
jgi:hypothetical protein